MSEHKSPEEQDKQMSPEAAHQMEATDGGLRGTGGSPGYGVNSSASSPTPEQHKEAAKKAPPADQKPASTQDTTEAP